MKPSSGSSKVRTIVYLLAGVLLASLLLSGIIGSFIEDGVSSGNVAVIPIHGIISYTSPVGINTVLNPTAMVALIDKAAKAPNIKAIVLDINSGGGSPVASETIVNAVKALEKPSVAIIRDIGASGAYWVASAANTVIASKYSLTGSIGVRGSYIEFAGLLQHYNISYNRIVGGELKDVGDPFKELSSQERQLLQKRVDEMHKLFLEDVQLNRNLTEAQLAQIATASFYLGGEAQQLGLVDIVGGDEELKQWLMSRLNTSSISYTKLEPKRTLLERLPLLFSKSPAALSTSPRISLS